MCVPAFQGDCNYYVLQRCTNKKHSFKGEDRNSVAAFCLEVSASLFHGHSTEQLLQASFKTSRKETLQARVFTI